MPTYRFKQFKVYQDAKQFRKNVLHLLKKLIQCHAYDLVDQIRRASLSIILNIAEGSSKKSDIEFARYLETSISSANEVVAGFDVAHNDELISADDLTCIENEAEEIINQLGGFIKRLRSNKKGVKC